MKNMKYICLLLLCPFFLGLVSCADEEESTKIKNIDGLQLQLCVAESNIISPITKSGENEDDANKINDLNILIYKSGEENSPVYAKHYTTTEGMKGLSVSNNSLNNAVEYNIHLNDGTYKIRAIANANKDMEGMSLSQVDGERYDLQGKRPQFIMYASREVTLNNGKGSAELALTRIYSKITVKVEPSGLDEGVVITPISISYHNIPSTGGFSKNMIDKENVVASNEEFLLKDDLSKSHEEAIPFYMYENSQPTGLYSTQKQIDKDFPTTKKPPVGYDKTPYYFNKPINITETISTDKQSSYIEVIANYKKNSIEIGTIKYRFFLGKNYYDDFNVERNTHYKITLLLSGTGGKDEVSWRVETDMEREINVSDIYIGYLDKSSGDITVTTKDGNLLRDLTITTNTSNNIVMSAASGSGNTRTFKATAQETNLMQDAYNVGTFTITATFVDGSMVSKPVRVHQVSRLVDPIAFYRKAGNNVAEEIKVLEYKRGDLDYHVLTSDGPWTATIEKGNWFHIWNDNNRATSQNASIGGDGGEIRFTYQPQGSASENRYGVILVKYHNNNCEHRIYLRQGYEPTVMPGAENAAWSMFNCYGDGDSDKKMVESPTQTGYFYQAGSNKRFHPFNPGFEEEYSGYPIDRNGFYNNGTYFWMNNQNTPCPVGYRLPSANEISGVANTNQLLQGFVHDDDPNAGWSRVSGEIHLEDNIHCNPAKGTLIVDPSTGKSIFFSYGKGVLTSHNYSYKRESKPFDIDLDEIGVGARGQFGKLRYCLGDKGPDRYGALYYTSSESTFGNTLKAMDFWYDMTSPSKNGNVIFNPSNNIVSHGAFVRCVRDNSGGGGKPVEPDKPTSESNIKAIFYRSTDWSWEKPTYSLFTGTIYINIYNGYTFLSQKTINIKNGVAVGNYEWLREFQASNYIDLQGGAFNVKYTIGDLLTKKDIKFF